MESKTIYTIGHSTRTIEHFLSIVDSFKIDVLVDIRTFPASRKFPHFNQEALAASAAASQLKYIHIKELGGRRKANPDTQNTAWRHPAFRGYADYMETPFFSQGIELLVQLAMDHSCVIMCSEAVWWRCHRSMVADYLKSHGWNVLHIMERKTATEHPYTAPARIVNGKLSYKQP